MTQNTTNLITQTIGLDLGDKRSVAVVATARKLASILYALWKTPMAFELRKAGLTKESTEAA